MGGYAVDMNVFEARLAIIERIRDCLLDLADEGGEAEALDDAAYLDMEASMADAAEILLDALELQVVSVDASGRITVQVYIGSGADR